VQLRSVIVTAPDRLRHELQTLPERRLLERCSHFRRSSSCPVDELAAKLVLRTLARRIEAATAEAEQLKREAAFARLAGVAPVPASSGQTVRHRLSRGGDRQLNRAVHTIVLHRRQHDATTRGYVERRVAEGKSRREATRLLKRYLARHLFRLQQQTEPLIDLTSHRSIIPQHCHELDIAVAPPRVCT
jgi:transposase